MKGIIIANAVAINGCTDSTATNYDSTATVNDGSCIYGCTDNEVIFTGYDIGGDTWNGGMYYILNSLGDTVASGDGMGYWYNTGAGYGSQNTFHDTLCLPTGCYDLGFVPGSWSGEMHFVFDPIYVWPPLSAFGWNNYSNISIGAAACGTVTGCTDSTATNYYPFANTDDGSCIIFGCTDTTALNYNSLANFDNGSCVAVAMGCTDSTAANYDATANTDDGSCCFNGNLCIGSSYQGGIIFYMDGNGGGLIAAPTDQSTGAEWGCFQTAVSGADGTAIGTGAQNTIDIVNANCPPYTPGHSIAADICDTLTLGGYSDWFLPSKDELNEMYLNIGQGNALGLGNIGGFVSDYWSSTEHNTARAFGFPFNGGYAGTINKNYALSVRAVRAFSAPILGCTDSTATNYDPTATIDDGSCVYVCNEDAPSNIYSTNVIQVRATINWDNMNSSSCIVDQYRINYREQGTTTWSSKTMGSPVGSCNFGNNKVDKLLLNLASSTTYEYYMKAWYCGGGVSTWSAIQNFTTTDECPNVINFAVSSPTTTKASFTWDTTSAYSFARIKLRVDTTGGVWTSAGGFGVFYPALSKDKNGLNPGTSYRAQARTWCDPTGGAYRSAAWSPLVFWTQPTSVRLEGGSAINNLFIYPNPSRDIFNISFTSDTKQNLSVRIFNVIGEELINDKLEQFIGEYTKAIDLATYTKGVYILEITTNNGVVNKKLILQ
jgi:hypothetical protein